MHEDRVPEERRDRFGAEGLRGRGDVSDAGRGGHLQGEGECGDTVGTPWGQHWDSIGDSIGTP